MKLTNNYEVRWHDTNANREMTPSAVLVLMQEMANLHIKKYYPNLEDLRDKENKAFILSKIFIRFHKPIYAYENVNVSTWTGEESKGYSFYRNFMIERNGEVIADALSLWALTDIEKKALLPVADFPIDFGDEKSIDMDMPKRIRFPKDLELEAVGKKTIHYSDIDYNSHMNNTHYPNMLIDFLPDPERHRVKGMTLSFVAGSLYNEEISIYRVFDGESFYFKTTNSEGKTCLEAIVTTEEKDGNIR